MTAQLYIEVVCIAVIVSLAITLLRESQVWKLIKKRLTKHKYPYKHIHDVFNDFYSGKGIKHNETPDTSFKYGDVVTGEYGLGLGLHSGKDGIVYTRVEQYFPPYREFGGSHLNLKWHKTGVNVSWEKWDEVCREYWR